MSGRSRSANRSNTTNTTKVFVGSLPAGTTVEELRNLFAPYGAIAECDVVNRCGFIHLEDKHLAYKAIDELNDFHFKGSRIIVEKGRVKHHSTAMRRNRNDFGGGDGGSSGGGGSGGGGPMRGNRDYYRGAPYERRGPVPMSTRGDNYSYGYETRPPLLQNMMMGSGPDRRPYIDERNRYSNSRYGYGDAPYDRPTSRERNNSHSMVDRRPLMDAQVPPINGGGGSYSYDVHRRPQLDIPSKSMGGYNNIPHDSPYGLAYPPLQQQEQQPQRRRFDNGPGPGPRRDTSLPRRY